MSTPGMIASEKHIKEVEAYAKSQAEALKKRQAEYADTIKKANAALHDKFVKLEDDYRKQMNEKISEAFGPNPRQAAVGKAIQDFNAGKTSKAAEKIDDKKKQEETKKQAAEKKAAGDKTQAKKDDAKNAAAAGNKAGAAVAKASAKKAEKKEVAKEAAKKGDKDTAAKAKAQAKAAEKKELAKAVAKEDP